MNKWLGMVVISIVSTSVLAENLGKTTYEIACKNCHAPQLAKSIRAPAAFNRKEWQVRYRHAEHEAKKYPKQYQSATDYLLHSLKLGKGLMQHGGLCHEAPITHKDCSDAAMIQAIRYMSSPYRTKNH